MSLDNVVMPASARSANGQTAPADWERLLSSLDNGRANIYDGIYGGPQPPSLADFSSMSSNSPDAPHETQLDTAVSSGNREVFNLDGSWSPANAWVSVPDLTAPQTNVPQSVLSFGSDETDEWGDLTLIRSGSDEGSGQAIMIPGFDSPTAISTANDAFFSNLDISLTL